MNTSVLQHGTVGGVRPVDLDDEALSRARELAFNSGRSIADCLGELTGLGAVGLARALAALFGYVPIDAEALRALQPDFGILSFTECAQRNAFAARGPDATYLVLSDPFDEDTEDWALRRLGLYLDDEPTIVLASAEDVAAFIADEATRQRAIDGAEFLSSQAPEDEVVVDVISLSTIDEEASDVVRVVNSTIYDALMLRASDIHLECDATCLHVQYRVDGVLMPITRVNGPSMAEQVISRVKVMADLDIAERRVPQDGRFRVRVNERDIDFRVSVMPNAFGEDAVLRLLDRQSLTRAAEALQLGNLGLDLQTITMIRRLAQKPHGMLLVTGPTGSGKTTTLYAAITEIHTGRDKIITIEDPVEYRLPRVLQIPVNEKKGLTFARGLRSILRHDPDKIMVGEIRDDETAQIAVQAALTGHLVFTTVHANNVFDVLGRFLHMGVDAYSFAASLNGIVAQRLLRTNCPACMQDRQPSEQELSDAQLTASEIAGWRLRAGRGCVRCRQTGYQGRKAVAEVLVLDDVLRELIAARAPVSELKERAARNGMRGLRAACLALVAAGETTLEELLRVAG